MTINKTHGIENVYINVRSISIKRILVSVIYREHIPCNVWTKNGYKDCKFQIKDTNGTVKLQCLSSIYDNQLRDAKLSIQSDQLNGFRKGPAPGFTFTT